MESLRVKGLKQIIVECTKQILIVYEGSNQLGTYDSDISLIADAEFNS